MSFCKSITEGSVEHLAKKCRKYVCLFLVDVQNARANVARQRKKFFLLYVFTKISYLKFYSKFNIPLVKWT